MLTKQSLGTTFITCETRDFGYSYKQLDALMFIMYTTTGPILGRIYQPNRATHIITTEHGDD